MSNVSIKDLNISFGKTSVIENLHLDIKVGEFVVLLHPTAVASDDGKSLQVLRLLLQELALKTAVRLAAEITGASRNALYDTALQWKRDGAAPDGGANDSTG